MDKIEDMNSGFGSNNKPELRQENNIEKEESIDEFEERLIDLRNKVISETEEIEGGDEDYYMKFWEDCEKFSRKIYEKFGDEVYSYVSWNVIGGSTLIEEKDRKVLKNKDFPEEYNIENFYNDFLENLNEIGEFKKYKRIVR